MQIFKITATNISEYLYHLVINIVSIQWLWSLVKSMDGADLID